MITVDTDSFFAIVVAAALLVAAVPRRLAPPVVVLGILIGAQVFPAHTDDFVSFSPGA